MTTPAHEGHAASAFNWRKVPTAAPDVGAPPPFFIYETPALNQTALLHCEKVQDWPFDDSAAEVPMLRLLSQHSARVMDPEAAALYIIPLLPRISHRAQNCLGMDHARRMEAAARALAASPHFVRRRGSDHLLITNTFRLASFGAVLPLLQNASVGWFEHPLAEKKHKGPNKLYDQAAWRCTIVVPYLVSPFCRTRPALPAPDERPTSVFFQGSVDAGRGVRRHFEHLNAFPRADVANHSRSEILKVAREDRGSSSRFSPRGTAEGMLRSQFCLVPKGDTPTSSRLYLALACGCAPILISNEFAPHQPFLHVLPPSKHFWNVGLRANRTEGLGEGPRPLFILEPAFMKDPLGTLTVKLQGSAGLGAHLRELRAALEDIAPDVLYDVEHSRVAHNTLLEWKAACSGAEPPPPGLLLASGRGAKAKGHGKAAGKSVPRVH